MPDQNAPPRMRQSRTKEQVRDDIIRLINNNDLSDSNTFLVINGGTGIGKTHSIMTAVQETLTKKYQCPQSMLVVESRTATVAQVNNVYIDQIETFNGIDVCQRLTFMHLIQRNNVTYNWVIIDECHGLFSEASFAEDAEFIINWIRKGRNHNTHIIFVTANDEYFDDLSRQFFPDFYNFIYLFPDFTQYVSNTYVKEIQFIKTNRTDAILNSFLSSRRAEKGIIFFKKASDVKDWFFKLLEQNYHVGMIVSQANETTAALTSQQIKQAQDLLLDISDGQIGLTMADLCAFIDIMRAQAGKEPIRQALQEERLPADIDILLATDTIQEGISICSPINYIFIEGYTEVEVRQKLGRFRGNLDLLYILFNPTAEARRLNLYTDTYNVLQQLIADDNQVALAEFYGTQNAIKSSIKFLSKIQDPVTKTTQFVLNVPAFLNYQRNLKNFLELKNDTENSIKNLFTYPLLNTYPLLISYEEIRDQDQQQKLRNVLRKWQDIPLKGKAQEEIVADFLNAEIVNKERKKIDSFRKICNFLKDNNIELQEKQATKKDLEKWPQYLSKVHEKYKVLLSPATGALQYKHFS